MIQKNLRNLSDEDLLFFFFSSVFEPVPYNHLPLPPTLRVLNCVGGCS